MPETDNTIVHDGFEYRSQGREIHRRPIRSTGLQLKDKGWLVLNHEEYIPDIVRSQFTQPSANLSYD